MRCFPYVALIFCCSCSLESSPIDSPTKRVLRSSSPADNVEHLIDAASAGARAANAGSSGAAGRVSTAAGHGGSEGGAGRPGTVGHAPDAPDAGADTDASMQHIDAGQNPEPDAGTDAADEDAGPTRGLTCVPCTASSECTPGYTCALAPRADVDGPANRCVLVAEPCPAVLIQASVTSVEGSYAVGCIPKYTCSYWLAHPDGGL